MSQLDPKFVDKLSEEHKLQIEGFLAFFRRNIEALKQELGHTFGDESSSLSVSLYTVEEVTAKLSSLQTSINAQIHSEFEHYLMQCVLYLAQLFLQAEGQGVSVQLDTNQLDDAQLLASLRDFRIGAGARNLEEPGVRRLASISPVDVNLVAKIKDTEAKVSQFEERVKELQQQLIASARKNELLAEENASLTKQVDNLQASQKDELVENLQLEIKRLKEVASEEEKKSSTTIDDLKEQLRTAKAELEDKIRATTQFQQLQKLLGTKNELINALREQVKTLQAEKR